MDIALVISKYLEDKQHLVTPDDSLSIIDNSIHRWDFKDVNCPTMEELEQLWTIVQAESNQEAINTEAQAFLDSTDWMIIRQLETGVLCPQNILEARAAARARIVR